MKLRGPIPQTHCLRLRPMRWKRYQASLSTIAPLLSASLPFMPADILHQPSIAVILLRFRPSPRDNI